MRAEVLNKLDSNLDFLPKLKMAIYTGSDDEVRTEEIESPQSSGVRTRGEGGRGGGRVREIGEESARLKIHLLYLIHFHPPQCRRALTKKRRDA